MSTLKLTASSPAQSITEPLSVAEVEHYLRLPTLSPEDEDRTSLLEVLITSARETAEIYQCRDLVEKQWDLALPYFYGEIPLRAPLSSVDLVQYTDSDGNVVELTEDTDFIVDTAKQPGVILPVYGGAWPSFTPWPTSPVLVRFTSGYGTADEFWSDAGQRILVGMKMLIAHWYNNRGLATNVPGSRELPFSVTSLLSMGALSRGA